MFNFIQIKRRLLGQNINSGIPTLSSGELAYNENSNELYYGHTNGTVTIAGSGSYLKLDGNQTVSGDKTFNGATTLSSTTFSPDSTIDFGGNKLTNVAEPSASTDATTKNYVDTEISNLNISGGAATEALSSEIYNTFVKLTDDRAVNLSSGLTVSGGFSTDTISASGDSSFGGNLTVTGNLSVLGTQTVINTETINISGTSTQIDVVNNGTGTGITVNQTGNQDVAEFKDDGATALIIKDGGNVGIGTATPNAKLTVTGDISATGSIYAANGIEISTGGGSTSLYVEDGKVGINTETPNEALTVVGSISASADIFAVNGTLTGTLSVDGSSTLNGSVTIDDTLNVTGAVDIDSTLNVDSAATFASTVSAQGALTVDGATTLTNTLDVSSAATFASTVSAQGALTVDGSSTLNGSVTIDDTLNVTGAVDIDSTLNVDSDASIGGNLTVTGNLSVLGTQTVINTETINISGTSTQIDVVNNGTGTGITVNQTGSQNIAEFYDDANIALAIVDGGNVGIGTLTPSEKLTIAGNVSASGNVTAVNGDFSGTLTVSSSVSAAGALTVDGATTLTNTLDVLNAATFSSTVSAQGALSIDGTSTLTGNVSAGADIIGVAGSSLLVDFIIDGGMF